VGVDGFGFVVGGTRYIKTEWRWGGWVWEERWRVGGRYGCYR
jgi:hypothetical protein